MTNTAAPVIHNPVELQNQWEADRRNVQKLKTQIQSLKNLEAITIKMSKFEFRLEECERKIGQIVEILAAMPKPKKAKALKAAE
jgi:hypothetical protein